MWVYYQACIKLLGLNVPVPQDGFYIGNDSDRISLFAAVPNDDATSSAGSELLHLLKTSHVAGEQQRMRQPAHGQLLGDTIAGDTQRHLKPTLAFTFQL